MCPYTKAAVTSAFPVTPTITTVIAPSGTRVRTLAISASGGITMAGSASCERRPDDKVADACHLPPGPGAGHFDAGRKSSHIEGNRVPDGRDSPGKKLL